MYVCTYVCTCKTRSHKTLDEIYVCKVEKYKLAKGVAKRDCSPKRTRFIIEIFPKAYTNMLLHLNDKFLPLLISSVNSRRTPDRSRRTPMFRLTAANGR